MAARRGRPRRPSSPGALPLSLDRALAAARAASSKTLDETVVLDVAELIGITDHFVIASGRNDRQVKAVVDEVTAQLKKLGSSPLRKEGADGASWVLLDYGDVVVHVLASEARGYYGLERLWSDATRIDWDVAPVGHAEGRW